MRGSVYKRCTCPVRRDERGRKITCGKAHGSWFYKVDVPGSDFATSPGFTLPLKTVPVTTVPLPATLNVRSTA